MIDKGREQKYSIVASKCSEANKTNVSYPFTKTKAIAPIGTCDFSNQRILHWISILHIGILHDMHPKHGG